MPLEKIADPPKLCRHPDHELPSHLMLEPGRYKHTCAGCGRVTTFVVPERSFSYPLRPLAKVGFCPNQVSAAGGHPVGCGREAGHTGDCDFIRGTP